MARRLVFGVTSYSWDVVESCLRLTGLDPIAVAAGDDCEPDVRDLPGLVQLHGLPEWVRDLPATVGPAASPEREAAVLLATANGIGNWNELVDPTAVVSRYCSLGVGTYVNAGTVISARTVLGRHVGLNRGCAVGHHNVWGDFAATGPRVTTCGGVHVGARAFLGAGCIVLPEVSIGDRAFIGAGAVVTRDVEPGALVRGNPARPN